MKKEVLIALLGYFQSKRKVISDLYRGLSQTTPDNVEKTAYLGYLLHNLYCATEEIFQLTAQTFENHISDLSRYHRELLTRMHIDLPGLRPRLLSDESFALLDELRRFRHVFRHSYEIELSAQKIGNLRNETLTSWSAVEKDFDSFAEFLGDQLRR